jgi:hypothetical protein
VSVVLRLSQDLEVLAERWPGGNVAALLPEVVHGLVEGLAQLVVSDEDGEDRLRRAVGDEVGGTEARNGPREGRGSPSRRPTMDRDPAPVHVHSALHDVPGPYRHLCSG